MRTDNLVKVSDAIGTGKRSISEIRSKTGLSYNTIKAALPLVGAEHVPGTVPKQFMLPGKSKATKRKSDRPTVELEVTEHDDWPTRWNNARIMFAKQVQKIEIDPKADPKELAGEFKRAAVSLASAGAAIEANADKPDWYTLIGGVLESDTETK